MKKERIINDNKFLVDENVCTLNKATKITSSIINNIVSTTIDGVDDNGISVIYDDSGSNEIENSYKDVDNTNKQKT